MSLLNALFGSKPKRDKAGTTTTTVFTPPKPEQDFVILTNNDFKKNQQQTPSQQPYPNLEGLHIGPNNTAGAQSRDIHTLDRVPFKISDRFNKQDSSAVLREVSRSLNDIGHRIEFYNYDFNLENAVLNAKFD